MATFRVSFLTVEQSARSATGATMPVPSLGSAVRLTDLETSNQSQVMQREGADWVAPRNGFISVFCNGDVNIAANAEPTASATAGIFLPANTRMEVSVEKNDKLAVIDA